MADQDRFAEFRKRAQERAATVVDEWHPEKEGDNRGGIIESVQFIEFQYGTNPSTVIVEEDGTKFRYNWMGTVPQALWDRIKPKTGDFCWIHHHGTRPQKDDMNEYNNIQISVIDPETGEEPVRNEPPVNVNVDTGEITNRYDLKDGEEEF